MAKAKSVAPSDPADTTQDLASTEPETAGATIPPPEPIPVPMPKPPKGGAYYTPADFGYEPGDAIENVNHLNLIGQPK